MRPRTLIIARDPGAANALLPVAKTGPAVVVGLSSARPVFERGGITCVGPIEDDDSKVVDEWFDRVQPQVMLTGTSREDLVKRDSQWWDAGRRRGLATAALLDHWVGYQERFSGRAPFDRLPDVVAVMDEYAKKRMVELGCSSERIAVTGHPGLDVLLDGELSGRDEIRKRWGVGERDWVVVFASEPQAQDHGGRLGYTETDVLRMVIESLRDFPARLVVKLHPRETLERLQLVLGEARMPAQFEMSLTPHQTLAGADTVIGMTSIFLLEAALAGRHVLSIQPAVVLEWTEHFRELLTVVRGPEQARKWLTDPLRRYPLDPDARVARNAAMGFVSRSTDNVWLLLEKMWRRG